MDEDSKELDPHAHIEAAEARAEDWKRQELDVEAFKPSLEILRDNQKQVREIVRSLALGGLAFAWIFKYPQPTGNGWVLPAGIASAMLFFGVSILFDLTQYLFGAHDLFRMFERWETTRTIDQYTIDQFKKGGDITRLFYYGKVAFALFGLTMVFISVWQMTTIR